MVSDQLHFLHTNRIYVHCDCIEIVKCAQTAACGLVELCNSCLLLIKLYQTDAEAKHIHYIEFESRVAILCYFVCLIFLHCSNGNRLDVYCSLYGESKARAARFLIIVAIANVRNSPAFV